MNEITIGRSKSSAMIFVGIGSAIGVIAGLLIVQERIEGWCFVVSSIVVLAAAIGGLLDRKPRLIITESGLVARALGDENISWDQVVSARIESIPRGGSFLILDCRNERRYRLFLDALELSPTEILKLVDERIASTHQ